MEDVGASFLAVLILVTIVGCIGHLIGLNQIIEVKRSFVLDALPGILGWIMAVCCVITNVTQFDDVLRCGGEQ